MPKPILVTGVTGLIGHHVVRLLLEKGHSVRGLHRTSTALRNIAGLPIELIQGDVRDDRVVNTAVQGCSAVIHCAGLTKLWHHPRRDFHDINVTGTENVCRAALKFGVERFVHTSSCVVMGPGKNAIPRDESWQAAAADIQGSYERSKFFGEEKVKDFLQQGLPAVMLRPTAVTGPGDIHGTPPGQFLRLFFRRGIPISYDCGINFVDARDVAAAHVAALTHGPIGDTYAISGHNLWMHDLFALLERATGIKAPRWNMSFSMALVLTTLLEGVATITRQPPLTTVSALRARKHPWFFDCSKAMRDLGFLPRPLDETIRDTAAWYRAEGILTR